MSVEQLKVDAIDAAQKYKARYKQTLDPNDLDMFKRFMDVYNHLEGIGGGGEGAVRTIDSYTATEGQTDFVISVAFDFFDVYLNGARLIESEYSLSESTITLISPAELNDEVIIVSYKNTSVIDFSGISTVGSDLYLFYNY